ncbi:hypothetical protein SAMD00019534_107790 [Acytostelium subglobosum LB1]|uniref:hypothetical protein n=1 Tax=Acytostelium subglobosum LB1 TaxID=1410327 RepID=UPI000644CBD8|nr:hypothetical protein SAMD00019534_107790 [Acytostelium subglobosum LB1]GAM27603.1 hypothetical protein SAMD00019534_107790 [Acytostelium subglobosum LB1]|eukprot:XP_012749262.1 hypothetical protein SAMD00019534_107790 [Acytostelium subglobosum LB1]
MRKRFNGATMVLKDSTGKEISRTTGTNGAYLFNGLNDQLYCIEAIPTSPNYVAGLYKNDNAFNNGRNCFVANPSKSNAHFALVKIDLYDSEYRVIRSALTSVDGSYEFHGLNACVYCASGFDTNEKLVPEMTTSTLTVPTASILVQTLITLIWPRSMSQLGAQSRHLIRTIDYATGEFELTGLPAGSYWVKATPGDSAFTAGPKQNDNVFENGEYCFNVGPSITTAHLALVRKTNKVSGFIWNDSQNNKGIMNKDKPFGGVRMVLSKDGKTVATQNDLTGAYSFEDLTPGSYCLTASRTDNTYSLGVNKNDNHFTNPGGKYCFRIIDSDVTDANIGWVKMFGLDVEVWDDSLLNKGIHDPTKVMSDVKVEVIDAEGKVISTLTTPQGPLHINLPQGSYCLAISKPDFLPSEAHDQDNHFDDKGTLCFDLDTDNVKYLGALYKPRTKFSVSGFAWDDSELNQGTLDKTKLFGPWGMNLTDKDGNVLESKTVTGAYSFTDLDAGDYCINATLKVAGNQYYWWGMPRKDSKFDGGKYCFTLGPDDITNAHIRSTKLLSYSIRIWDDTTDNQGIFDEDKLIQGINFELRDEDGVLIYKRASYGGALILKGPPGKLCINLLPPFGKYIPSSVMKNDNIFDSNGRYCFTLDKSNPSIKGAMVRTVFNVSGFAWDDSASNAGLLDTSKPLNGAMKMDLTDKDGQVLNSVPTFNGNFSFADMPAGDYCLKATPVETKYHTWLIPKGDSKFKDLSYCFTLGPDMIDANIRASLYRNYTLTVWDDTVTNQGLYDSTKNISGIKVQLKDAEGSTNYPLLTTTNGPLKIRAPQGMVCMTLTSPDGKYVPSTVKKNDNLFDSTGNYCFKLERDGLDLKGAMVEAPTFSISGNIWDDSALDQGTLDINKPLAGVVMVLKDKNGKDLITLDNTATSAGTYEFENIPAGDYCIQGTYTAGGYWPSLKNKDSKFDNAGVYCFKLGPDITNAHYGLIKTHKVSGSIWDDSADKQGKLDPSKLVPNVDVTETDASGATFVFKSMGRYFYYVKTTQNICLQLTPPAGYTALGTVVGDNKFDNTNKACFLVDKDMLNVDGALIKSNRRR